MTGRRWNSRDGARRWVETQRGDEPRVRRQRGDYFKVTLPGWVLRAEDIGSSLPISTAIETGVHLAVGRQRHDAAGTNTAGVLPRLHGVVQESRRRRQPHDTLSGCPSVRAMRRTDTRRTRRIRSPGGRLSGSSRASASFSATINARWATRQSGFGGWAHRMGRRGPHDAGGYNNLPHETGFSAHTKMWDRSTASFSCRGTRASRGTRRSHASMREVRVWRQGEIWRSRTRHQVRWGALVVQLSIARR